MSLFVDIKKKIGMFNLDIKFETVGGVTGLLGASGSGKSMTLMCVAGIVKPDSGRIVLNGKTLFDSRKRVNLKPQARNVGYFFQNYALFPNMTVKENILCGIRNERDSIKKAGALREICALTRIEGLENRRPTQLSGGQQQRVALARILIGSPDIIMLDEPFSALDAHLSGQLQVETQRLLKQFGKDSLIVTHNREEAYRLCPRIALLDEGRLLVYKDTKALFTDPESRQAALLTGCKNVAAARKTGNYEIEATDWGIRLTTAQPVRDGLCAVGVRAHYFNPKTAVNRYPVRFVDEVEGPFEYILQFRYINQTEDSQSIWWRVPKEKRGDTLPEAFGVAPANVMLLYS
jgi:molybdate transport system ATP-binding protein